MAFKLTYTVLLAMAVFRSCQCTKKKNIKKKKYILFRAFKALPKHTKQLAPAEKTTMKTTTAKTTTTKPSATKMTKTKTATIKTTITKNWMKKTSVRLFLVFRYLF